MKIAVLPGDGIGTEIVAEAVKVLQALDLKFEMETALVGGDKTLDRIADEIGYESASAFSTAFRKRQGCSPGRFARSLAA